MCGIAGFVGQGSREVLQRMTDAIRHRGPDADGLWVDEAKGVYLGHRRLAIVDLSGGGQPMWTADGATGIVFNGEIYNHAELRAELEAAGCRFATDHSDTETLLHGYRTWGDAFVERLNGMWAFVIYDRAKGRLFASRDRFGKKPLYYFHEGGALGFASELPSLLEHPQSPRLLSALSLQKYFAYCFVPAPRSIIERVWKLPGGHSFCYDLAEDRLKVWRWWEFVLEPEPWPALKIDEACERLREALERAVKRRLMSDVPLGIFLSGGIDSSAVAALAARHTPVGALQTFSIGFNEKSFDESAYAALMARRLGTDHHHQTLDLDKSAALLPELASRLDEPLGDSSLLPTYLLSQFTRQRVTVALGGDGGDELFAGYDPFRALRAAELYAKFVPRPLHIAARLAAARLPVSHANMSLDFKIKRTLAGLSYAPPLWNPVWMGAVEPRDFPDLLGNPAPTEEIYSEAIAAWDRCTQKDPVDRSLQFWTNLYLQDGILAKVDRASMLCSLEARSPFLDLEVVDLARRLPWQAKLHGRETKWILKRALEPLLPAEIVQRPKKGFGMPVGRWLREGLFDFSEAALPSALNRDFVRRRRQRHLANQSDERLFLWCAWILASWTKRHLPSAP